jgi:hypothetical protein
LRNDVLRDAIGEELVLRIRAEAEERQHRHRQRSAAVGDVRRRPAPNGDMPQVICQLHHRRIGLEIEICSQTLRMIGRVLQCAGPVSSRIQREHQRARVGAGMRIGRDEAAARPYPAAVIPRLLLRLGQRDQRTHVRVIELGPTFIEPVAVVRRIVEVESVQQRTRVELDHPVRFARGDRSAELVQVAPHDGRVQQESVARRRNRAFAERGPQDVDGEVEQPAGIGHVTLGPEQRHRPVTRDGLRPRCDDQCQECNAVTLRRRAAQRSVAGAQTRAPEQLNRDHRPRFAANP